MLQMRRWLYLLLLIGFTSAALLRLAFGAISVLASLIGWSFFDVGGVPLIGAFDDPLGHLLAMTKNRGYVGNPYANPGLEMRYYLVHGPLVVALAIAFLGIRRARAFRAMRSIAPPPAFRGFAVGIAAVGVALMVLELAGARFPWPVESGGAGAILAFVAFLIAELAPSGSRTATVPAREASGPVSPQASSPGAVVARRRPVWTILALAFPLGFGLAAYALATSVGQGSLAPVALLLVGVAIGLALGAIATVIGIARRERWVPLQVLAFLLNFGAGVPILGLFLR